MTCVGRRMSRLAAFTAAAILFAGCASEKYGAFEPKGGLAPSNPTAYAEYGKAMSHCDGYSMAYEWQRENQKAVEAARMNMIGAEVRMASVRIPQRSLSLRVL